MAVSRKGKIITVVLNSALPRGTLQRPAEVQGHGKSSTSMLLLQKCSFLSLSISLIPRERQLITIINEAQCVCISLLFLHTHQSVSRLCHWAAPTLEISLAIPIAFPGPTSDHISNSFIYYVIFSVESFPPYPFSIRHYRVTYEANTIMSLRKRFQYQIF